MVIWTLHNTYRIPGHTSISFICIRNLHTITLKSQIDTCYCYVLRTVVKYCYIKMEILLKKTQHYNIQNNSRCTKTIF